MEFVTPVASPGRTNQPGAGSAAIAKTPAALPQKMSFQKMSSIDYYDRAFAYYCNSEYDQAIADYHQALAINPDYAEAYNWLAWLLATCPDKKYRHGKRAVENARKACQLSDGGDWPYFDTLAAAYAECGDFEKAKQWQAKAIEAGPDDKELHARRELYMQGKPFREERK